MAVLSSFGVLQAVTITAFADAQTGDPIILGDADGDGEVTVLDATEVRRSLAGLVKLSTRPQAAVRCWLLLQLLRPVPASAIPQTKRS